MAPVPSFATSCNAGRREASRTLCGNGSRRGPPATFSGRERVSMPRSKAAASAALLMVLAVLPLAAAPVAAQDHAANASAAQAAVLNYWTKDRIANAKPRDFVRNANGTLQPGQGPTKGKPAAAAAAAAATTSSGVVERRRRRPEAVRQGPVHDEQRRLHLHGTLDHGPHDTTGRSSSPPGIAPMTPPTVASPGTGPSIPSSTRTRRTPARSRSGAAGSRPRWRSTTASPRPAASTRRRRPTTGRSRSSRTAASRTTWPRRRWVPRWPSRSRRPAVNSQTFNFGYPAAGKYHGYDLIYCSDQIFNDPLNRNLTFGVDCDMTGGSSGGPWLGGFNATTGAGTVDSVNSYGYSGAEEGIRPEVQRQHLGHVQRGADRGRQHPGGHRAVARSTPRQSTPEQPEALRRRRVGRDVRRCAYVRDVGVLRLALCRS